MDKTLETAMELSRDPMLAMEDGKIVYMNAAAHAAFPGGAFREPGSGERTSLERFLPGLAAEDGAGRFTAVGLGNVQYGISCAALGETLLYAFAPLDAGTEQGLLSDRMMAGMLSTLFSIRLGIDKLASLLPGEGTDETEERYLSILRHGYFLLRRQLTNLNTARLLRDGAHPFAPRQTELGSFCAELVGAVSEITRPRQASLSFVGPKGPLLARVDPELLERLLLNLLLNSFQHTPPEGEVRLRLSRTGNSAVISVDDTGEGIPNEALRNIFTRYEERLDSEHLDRPVADGLGLSVASGLAKLHGGALIVESRPGGGTSVRVMLPLEQRPFFALEERDSLLENSMDRILTDLSAILGPESYTPQYLD